MCVRSSHTHPVGGTSAGLKLELKAEANRGSTGVEDGTPATAAAGRGATVATDETDPGSPMNGESTGLPAA